MNGISSHVLDYDDTYLKTVIHPAGPVASALLACAELMHAFVLGCEVECRMGNAVYPEHYQMGWHITGTAGGRRPWGTPRRLHVPHCVTRCCADFSSACSRARPPVYRNPLR